MNIYLFYSALFTIRLVVLAAIFHMVPAVDPIACFIFIALERTFIENSAEVESLLEAECFTSALAFEFQTIERLLLKSLLSTCFEFILAHWASVVIY